MLQYNFFFLYSTHDVKRATLSRVIYKIFDWKDEGRKVADLPLHAKYCMITR